MELVHNPFRGNTNSANEQPCLFLDDDINEVGELALSVVVLHPPLEYAAKKELKDWVSRWSCARCRRPGEGAGRHQRARSCPQDHP